MEGSCDETPMTTRLTTEQIQLMKDELTTELGLSGRRLPLYARGGHRCGLYFRNLRASAGRCHRLLLPEPGLCVLLPRERAEDRPGFVTLPTYFPFIYIRRDIRKDGIGDVFLPLSPYFCLRRYTNAHKCAQIIHKYL